MLPPRLEPKYFYALVAVLTGIDMAMMIALFWSSLKNTGSPLTLGVVLCFSVLLPFGLQRLRQRHRMSSNANSAFRRMLVLRLGGYVAVFAAVLLNALYHVLGFVMVALVMGVLGYLTTSALEALNTRFTLLAGIASEQAARWMQTAIQLGAFSGAALGGLLLDRLGIDLFAFSLCTTGVVTALASMPFPFYQAAESSDAIDTSSGKGPISTESQGTPQDAQRLKALSLALGMIGFHIGTFNTLTPIIYQSLNHWTAADFGMASASAGVGAFLAAVLPRIRTSDYLVALGILAMDAVLVFADVPLISIAACSGIGYGINHLRIGLRRQLIDLAATPGDADRIAAVSAFYYLLMQSGAPLLLSLLVSVRVPGPSPAPYLFVSVPIMILLCLYQLGRSGTVHAAAPRT
jgi:hypothetical protein